jgi:plasmid stabilization system protein ParE
MEKAELLLIEKYIHRDEGLKQHVEEHKRLEGALEELNRRRYLTPEEQVERKNLQKRKLREKEKILRILEKHPS